MLWMKAWLELRFRLAFMAFFLAFPFVLANMGGPPPGNSAVPVFQRFLPIYGTFMAIVPIMLAASGVMTQSANLQSIRGEHKSVQFTLALPVSRLRLVSVRFVAGTLAVSALTVMALALMLIVQQPPDVTALRAMEFIIVTVICQLPFYTLSVLMSTLVDEVYKNWIGMAVAMGGGLYSQRHSLPAFIDLFSGMGKLSPLVTGVIPWPSVLIALILTSILFVASVTVVRNREY